MRSIITAAIAGVVASINVGNILRNPRVNGFAAKGVLRDCFARTGRGGACIPRGTGSVTCRSR